jgi:hypothetical protein
MTPEERAALEHHVTELKQLTEKLWEAIQEQQGSLMTYKALCEVAQAEAQRREDCLAELRKERGQQEEELQIHKAAIRGLRVARMEAM